MPELPEVESARQVIERAGLERTIADVDDSDTYECRPHAPGDLRRALVGRRLTAAHRRGKTMWCDTSDGGPALGIHLGMSGRIVVSPPADGPDADVEVGGDYGGDRSDGSWAPWNDRVVSRNPVKPEWYRFTLTYDDGGQLRLFDKRRLGRVRLDPDVDALGPDAEHIGREEFRERIGRGSAPLKARLLDQAAIAGIGNLLADEVLWRARLSPRGVAGAERGAAGRAAAGAARGDPPRGAPRRRPHGRGHRPPPGRRALPALRRGDGPRHGRRPHHLVVLGRAGLSAG